MEYPKIKVAKKEIDIGLEPVLIEPDRMVDVRGSSPDLTCDGKHVNIERRASGNLAGVSFYLSEVSFDWALGRDDEGNLCLMPLGRK